MVAQNLSDASPDADTPTRDPNGHNTTTVPWDNIAAVGLWQSGTAECGCAEHRHADDSDEYSGGAPATLHDPGRCARGRGDAELDPRLARHLNIPAPDDTATVSVTAAELAGVLRGVPADQALAAVAQERESEAAYAAAGIERIERRLALAAELDERGLGGDLVARLRDQLPPPKPRRRYLPLLQDVDGRVPRCGKCGRTRPAGAGAGTSKPAAAAGVPPIGNLGGAQFTVPPAPGVAPAPGGVPPIGTLGGPAPVTRAVPPTATTSPAPVAPPDPDEAELAAATAALEENPEDSFAIAVLDRHDEKARLRTELAPYLSQLLDQNMLEVEMDVLMDLTLAERAEVMEAALSTRLTRLGLTIGKLDPAGRNAKRAWLRLREGAAGKWTTDELAPFSDAQMQQLMNPTPVQVTIMQLFYDIGIHLLAGGGGIGKTWIALAACRAAVPPVPIPGRDHPYAVYLDMDQNYELHQRAGWLGMRWEDIQNRRVELMDVPAEAAKRGSGAVAMLRSVVAGLIENPPRVVVVDSLTRIMSELGEDSDNGDAITRVMSIFNDLARVCCVIVLDHTGHGDQTRPKGSAAKKDASRVVLTVEGTGFDAETYPHVIAGGKVHITKDRSGGVKRMHADPSDKTAVPVLGLIRVDFDEANGKAAVEIVPQKAIEAAETRRKSDEGVAAAEEARVAITAAVRDAGAPMAPDAIEKSVWPQFEGREKFTRNDFRKTLKGMFGKELIESGGTGRGGGKRYCLPGQSA
ncbi:Uncharacterised protein [Mycobacteroides abscessus subsp. abscessus]|uniref:AAA family ATPase n=1 Tax=Mycobacteroides abscessus TaxID=36809 RepID=UPI00092C4DA4|nr:AAA family ATPase [Mycobacteroides abscessus]SHR99290.1 Uncharacterised protein [Mycobacteroides abscessus subsp. abscessus]